MGHGGPQVSRQGGARGGAKWRVWGVQSGCGVCRVGVGQSTVVQDRLQHVWCPPPLLARASSSPRAACQARLAPPDGACSPMACPASATCVWGHTAPNAVNARPTMAPRRPRSATGASPCCASALVSHCAREGRAGRDKGTAEAEGPPQQGRGPAQGLMVARKLGIVCAIAATLPAANCFLGSSEGRSEAPLGKSATRSRAGALRTLTTRKHRPFGVPPNKAVGTRTDNWRGETTLRAFSQPHAETPSAAPHAQGASLSVRAPK